MDKAAIRQDIRERKRAMAPEEIRRRSALLLRRLIATPAYQNARTVYGYIACNQEVRTLPILRRALQDGKRIAVPKVFGDELQFLYLEDPEDTAPGRFGIPEPIADGPVARDPDALVLLPGLAFDRAGNRIGYGGGYYDRFLSREPGHPTIALCYRFQVFDRLETEPHDIPAEEVIWA